MAALHPPALPSLNGEVEVPELGVLTPVNEGGETDFARLWHFCSPNIRLWHLCFKTSTLVAVLYLALLESLLGALLASQALHEIEEANSDSFVR